jgi:uncharacterized protein YpmB
MRVKRKILTILLLGIISSSIVGCTSTEKKVHQAYDDGATINMVQTDVTIKMGDLIYLTYYDPDTKVVYMADSTNQRSGVTQYLGEDKQPMKLDEFLKMHRK